MAMAARKVREPEKEPARDCGRTVEEALISSRVHQAGSGFFQIYIWHTEISGSGPDCLKVEISDFP